MEGWDIWISLIYVMMPPKIIILLNLVFKMQALDFFSIAWSRKIFEILSFLLHFFIPLWFYFNFLSSVSSDVEISETLAFFFDGGLVTQSCPTLVIPWTIACQVPLSTQFFRQKYWSGFPFPPPRDLPDPGIKLVSPILQADSFPLSHQGSPFKSYIKNSINIMITL